MKTLVVFGLLMLVSMVAQAQMETCDRFSFAVSGTRLNQIPVTVLRGGVSPVLEIAGRTYNYDVSKHCMAEAGTEFDCSKPLKIMADKKVVGLIEGQGRVWISVADSKGKRDATQPHYEVAVERDPSSPSRPRFIVEAVGVDGKVLGRVDGIEGLTAASLQNFKGKLASAHHLVDLRGKGLVYANCRKLAVMHYNDGTTMNRAIASSRADVSTPHPSKTASKAPPLNATSSASVAPPPQR